ncbi:MAG: twin-arginine translocase TatA/TatE family subunit [Candidatus Hydrogenedentes bacterium]|nr:twin-arginine translocase TatA/TatE family subunit [Candidatus Hydrogenedentota bacterium]
MPQGSELIIILLVVLIIFGPTKLPQLGRSIGSAITEFKDGLKKKDEENPTGDASNSPSAKV